MGLKDLRSNLDIHGGNQAGLIGGNPAGFASNPNSPFDGGAYKATGPEVGVNDYDYDNGGGADIGGLVNGSQYYVYSKTVNTFKLSHSHSNCGDAAIISLSSVASSGTSHAFSSNGIPGAGKTWPNPNASIYIV